MNQHPMNTASHSENPSFLVRNVSGSWSYTGVSVLVKSLLPVLAVYKKTGGVVAASFCSHKLPIVSPEQTRFNEEIGSYSV